jgi:DNA polymerase III alpha subunit
MLTRRNFLKLAAATLATKELVTTDVAANVDRQTPSNLVTAAGPPLRSEIIVGGMVSAVWRDNVKSPPRGSTLTEFAFFDLQDSETTWRCIIWPQQFAQYQDLVVEKGMVAVRATVDHRDATVLIVEAIRPLATLEGWRKEQAQKCCGTNASLEATGTVPFCP